MDVHLPGGLLHLLLAARLVFLAESMTQLPVPPLDFNLISAIPALLLPVLAGVDKRREARIAVRVSMESESRTVARLYYAAGDEDFAQQRSPRVRVVPGLNSVSFVLPDDFQGGKLRFDPGEAEGRYVLHAIEGRIVPVDDIRYF